MAKLAIKTYLEPELAAWITRVALAEGRSDSAVIAEYLRARMSNSSPEAVKADADGVKRQLVRTEARLDKIAWELAQIKECLLLFVRVWLEYNPQLDAAQEEAAAASAEARFERFLDLVGVNLLSSAPLGDLDARIGTDGRDESAEQAS